MVGNTINGGGKIREASLWHTLSRRPRDHLPPPSRMPHPLLDAAAAGQPAQGLSREAGWEVGNDAGTIDAVVSDALRLSSSHLPMPGHRFGHQRLFVGQKRPELGDGRDQRTVLLQGAVALAGRLDAVPALLVLPAPGRGGTTTRHITQRNDHPSPTSRPGPVRCDAMPIASPSPRSGARLAKGSTRTRPRTSDSGPNSLGTASTSRPGLTTSSPVHTKLCQPAAAHRFSPESRHQSQRPRAAWHLRQEAEAQRARRPPRA